MPQMTRAEIRTELNNRGFEQDSADLNRYINWGYFDLARRLRVSEIESSVEFSLNAGEYRQSLAGLSNPQKSVRSLSVITSGQRFKMDPITEREFWNDWVPGGFAQVGATIPSEYTGEPDRYYIFEMAVIVMPCPTALRNFLIMGWDRVAELDNDSDSHILPVEYEEGLIIAITKQCHLRSNEQDRADRAEQRLNDFINHVLTENVFRSPELQEQTETAWT